MGGGGQRDELLEEQRRSYDRQVEKLEKIDTKVARTVRITAIVVGFVVATSTNGTRRREQ